MVTRSLHPRIRQLCMFGPASITFVLVFGMALPLCKCANVIKSTKQFTESINGRQLDLFNTKQRTKPSKASRKADSRIFD
ncbi:hypothetical protein Bhyg_07191, partial [Pseudolycoriella hygida]